MAIKEVKKNIVCMVLGHKPGKPHIDFIYGSLPRIHEECIRCEYTTKFERIPDEDLDKMIEDGVPVVDCF